MIGKCSSGRSTGMFHLDAQQLSTFADEGFLFFPAMFSDAEVAVLRKGAI